MDHTLQSMCSSPATNGSNNLGNRTLAGCEDYSELLRMSSDSTNCVNQKEIVKGETFWVKESQRSLTDSKAFIVWKRQSNPFLEGGVLSCTGRISNANIPYSTKHPALLCKQHHFTLLIVRDAHERISHIETLTEIQSKFWIIKGRQFVRRILHQCVIGRMSEGQSYSAHLPLPLPEFRVREAPAFSHTGVNLAGPLYIKE